MASHPLHLFIGDGSKLACGGAALPENFVYDTMLLDICTISGTLAQHSQSGSGVVEVFEDVFHDLRDVKGRRS